MLYEVITHLQNVKNEFERKKKLDEKTFDIFQPGDEQQDAKRLEEELFSDLDTPNRNNFV